MGAGISTQIMEENTERKREKYHLVLQKFINLILFGSVQNPKFSTSETEIKMHSTLLNFYKNLENEVEDKVAQNITSFFEDRTVEFRKQMKEKDLNNLILCYGFSNFRIIFNICGALGFEGKKKLFNIQDKDIEIASELAFSKSIPEEIKQYLSIQFFDIFNKIPEKSATISKVQYSFLIDRYVCEYDYDRVANILFRKFDQVI